MSSISRRKYSVTRGADFSNDESMVDYERAPICENIIPDGAGYPEKRPGWRVENEYEGNIYGLHKYTFGGVTKMLVHEGKRLWCDDTLLCDDMAENVSRSYQNEGDLIILDGQNYRVLRDNTGVAYGVPWLEQNDNKVVLDYHGAATVSLVERIFIGNEEYSTIDMQEAEFDTTDENYTAYETPADMAEFEMESRGYYVFIVDGERYLFYYDKQSAAASGVPYFEKNGNKVVLVQNGLNGTVYDIYWDYSAKYPEWSVDEEDACTIQYPDDDTEIEMTEVGFYAFKIIYGKNGTSTDITATYYFRNERERGKYFINNPGGLQYVSSGGQYTEGGIYIPTTSVSNTFQTGTVFADDGTVPTANGTAYEKVNKLSGYRRMTALGTGIEYGCYWMLDGIVAAECIGEKLTLTNAAGTTKQIGRKVNDMAVIVNGKRYDRIAAISTEVSSLTEDQAECLIDNGYYFVIVRTATSKDGGQMLTYLAPIYILSVSGVASKIKFAPTVTGRDNIEIYYKADTRDTDVSKCTVISEYDNNLFVTGNPDKPNFDWHSYVENPYYFPDLNYQKFGDNTAVLGYVNTGEYQAIVKADGAAGGSIYIRSIAEFNGERAYPVKQMASGVGGVSKDGFCSLIGDDLMLTKQGIFAFTTIDMTGEKTLSNRSWYVDGKLSKENLQNANMFVWQGKCMCAVEDKVYILNAEASMSRNYKNNVLYDCYFWTGIPIERVLVVNDELYFSNGSKLCKLNTDVEGMEKYNDDGAPIVARWGTKLDDDEDITRYKTMIKRGNTVTVKPFTRSSATVYLRTEKDNGKKVKEGITDIFDWENIDFSRISFDGTDTLREIIVNTKVKKYKRLQFVVENAVVNEGFGITEINKHYVYGNFIKR